MNARQLCNVTYWFLAEGRDEAGRAELDAELNPHIPRKQEQRRAFVLLAGGEIG